MRALYVHLPFCRSKCPYCGFYSVEGAQKALIIKYLSACIEDLRRAENRRFDTLYLGGGTPSSLPLDILENFIEALLKNADFSGGEFTVEANPESAGRDFAAFVDSSPITRVSLGVQSFDDRTLRILGRIHNASTALKAAENLSKTSAALSVDLMHDIPDVSGETALSSCLKATECGAKHVSAYAYSSEDTGYLPGFDPDSTQFEEVEHALESRGFFKYETSNFALPGFECLHNAIYWTTGEYVGIGAGAHSMLLKPEGGKIRYSRKRSAEEYAKNPREYDEYLEISPEESLKESLVIGLRMKKGINLNELEKIFGKTSANLINNIERYVNYGLLTWEGNILKTTGRGALVLDSLSASLWAC